MDNQEQRQTTVSGELFPPDDITGTGTAQNTTTTTDGEGMQSTFKTLAELRAICDETGVYYPLPTERLLLRGETLYNRNADKIRDVLETSGATAETIDVVLRDYAGVLAGIYSFGATPQQMQQALKGCKPYRAFNIDRYGLYMGLFVNYSRYLVQLGRYQDNVKHTDTTATEKTRREFMTGFYSAMDAKALTWLRDIGVIQPADFAGVEPAEVAEFFEQLKAWAALGDYSTYIFVAKYALMGTAEELAEVIQPPIKTQTSVLDFALRVADDGAARIDGTADKFAAMFEAEQREEQERAAQAAREQARIWRENTTPIPLHEMPNIICSRPVEISPNGPDIIGTLPIQRYIDDFTKRNPRFGLITPMTVQKVFEGVNLLPYFQPTGDNGKYSYNITREELAQLCGYTDANQPTQLALLGALVMLSNLFVVVNRPERAVKYTTVSGKVKTRIEGGLTAVRVVNVTEFELENGGIKLSITPEAMKGKPTLVTPETYKQLRAEAKGLSQSRFNYQLLTKGHKSEDDLLNEVFGYTEKLRLAADNAEELKQVKTYIRKHRPDDRKKMARWFADYAAKGIIKYTYTPPQKGARVGGVYSWERLNVPTDGTPEEQEQQP